MKRHEFDKGTGIHYKHFCGACGLYFSEPAYTKMYDDEPSWAICPADGCGDGEFDDCVDLLGGEDE